MAAQDPQAGGWSPALILVLVAVLLSGALFGYDQGVISGALTGLQKDFKLSALLVRVSARDHHRHLPVVPDRPGARSTGRLANHARRVGGSGSTALVRDAAGGRVAALARAHGTSRRSARGDRARAPLDRSRRA